MIRITKDNRPKNCVFNLYDSPFLRQTDVFVWFDGQNEPHVFWPDVNGKLNSNRVFGLKESIIWIKNCYNFKMVQSHVTNIRQIDFKKCEKIVKNLL